VNLVLAQECGPNEQFFKENCTCGCLLDSDLCQATLGPNWTLDESACDCICGLNATTASTPTQPFWQHTPPTMC
jgi:hypothetical protein